MRRHKGHATAGSVPAAAGAGAVARRDFRGQHRLCETFSAGKCLNNTEPDLEKLGLRADAHLSTLVESWSGPRWAGVSENGSERAGGLGSPHSLPGDLAMRSTVLGSLVGCITKRAESCEPRAVSREPSCVRGEARRLDLPRPHGQPSPTATPTLPPPARRRRPHAPARIPAVRDGASPASSGAWASR